LGGCATTELTKLTRAESKLLFECFAERRVRIISRGKRDLGNVYRTHPQFTSGAFHTQTANITNRAFAYMSSEYAVEVGDGKTSHSRQCFPIEPLVDVFTDVAHHIFDAVRIPIKGLSVGQHMQTIV